MRDLFHLSRDAALLAVLSVCAVFDLPAQNIFSNVPISGLQAVPVSSMLWWDSDDDGRLDVLFKEFSSPYLGQLWHNRESGFTNAPLAGVPNATAGVAAWGDYDNDGQMDLLLLTSSNGVSGSQLWRNTGSGFVKVPIPGLPQVSGGSAAWGDYDNDGRPDFLITGWNTNNSAIAQLWHNTRDGFTNVPIPGLAGVVQGSIAWADYDNDGWRDFLVIGGSSSQLWRNTSSGFTNVPIFGLPGVPRGLAVWGDYDGDGKLDFLLTGGDGGFSLAQLWRNTGGGFTNLPVPGLPGAQQGAVAWGDYDNDGQLDFVLVGVNFISPTAPAIAQLWRNTGAGFTKSSEAGLPGVYMGSAVCADYDNDGRLDILLCGATDIRGFFGISKLWRNVGTASTNVPPTAPTALSAALSNGLAILSWSAATDDHTPVRL